MSGPYRTPGKEQPRAPLVERALKYHDHYWERCKAFCKKKAEYHRDNVDEQIIVQAERGRLEGVIDFPKEVTHHPYYNTEIFCRYLEKAFECDFPSEDVKIIFSNYSTQSLQFKIIKTDKPAE